MSLSVRMMLVVMAALTGAAWGQSGQREPSMGYLYPAGGQRGSVFEIIAGGQFLRGVNGVHVTGDGVSARVVRYYKPVRNLNKEQRQELQRILAEHSEKRLAEMPEKVQRAVTRRRELAGRGIRRPRQMMKSDGETRDPVKLPPHPMLENLETKSLRELYDVAQEFFNRRKRQLNRQISDRVLVRVTIDAKAAPGDRELRLKTPLGLTNPMCFQVGLLPEAREQEPNGPGSNTVLPPGPPAELPILLNGQIKPGDVDRFRFRAEKGQQLVIETQARHLIPYLADAVPGWFQATLALYDAKGKELAFADDYRFKPDPVIFYRIPQTGEYHLEVRDSIYRGREDFVYRIAVAEQPFIKSLFPLGGRAGSKTVASIDGWNLSSRRLPLDTQPGARTIRQSGLPQNEKPSNRVAYAVDTLPECIENEPNDTAKKAQRIALPRIINGRIARPGDMDVFKFRGKAGEEVVAEVLGRRLHSSLDSLLRLTDASGRLLEWNDDHEDKVGHLHRDMGYITHHADSYIRARLPKDGLYHIQLADSQGHGGEAYGYRLRLSSPRPDFELLVAPSSINIRAGSTVPVWVYALRKDGFEGDIDLELKGAPAGFKLRGGRIPAGLGRIRVTLTAPRNPMRRPIVLHLEGRASIDGQTVSHTALPAEDMMQAFLYRHLVPSQELMVAVIGRRRRIPSIDLVGDSPVRVPRKGTVLVRFRAPRRPKLREVHFELSEPPKGVSLQDVTFVPGGLELWLKADGDAPKAGFADNLIVEAFADVPWGKRDGQKPRRKRRISLGVLPAIPFVVAQR